jgi:hypothetical protein
MFGDTCYISDGEYQLLGKVGWYESDYSMWDGLLCYEKYRMLIKLYMMTWDGIGWYHIVLVSKWTNKYQTCKNVNKTSDGM